MNFTTTRAYILLIILTPLIAFFSWFIKDFNIDASAETLLTRSNKKFIFYQKTIQKFEPSEFILTTFEPRHGSPLSRANMSLVEKLSGEIKSIKRVEAVNSLVNAPIFVAATNLSDLNVEELTWSERRFSENYMKKVLRSHPLYEGLLISEDQKAVSLQIVFKRNNKVDNLNRKINEIQEVRLKRELNSKEKNRLDILIAEKSGVQEKLNRERRSEIEKIRSILESYKQKGDFHLGGNNLLAYQLIKIITNDLYMFGGVILLLVMMTLYFLFRSIVWVFLSLLSCAASISTTMGLLGFFELKVTVISAHVISLQIILALAMIIHLIEKFRELGMEGPHNGDIVDQISKTVKEKARPCFFAGFTTSIGFGSLIFSGIQPVISFGWMMVLAMAVTICISLLFFPATLIVMRKVLPQPPEHPLFKKALGKAADFVSTHPALVSVGTVLTTLVFAFFCFLLTSENSFIRYFHPSTDVYKELTYIDKKFGGTTPLDIIYNIPPSMRQEGLILTAASVQAIENITERLSRHKAIGNMTSVADFTKVAHVVRGRPLSEHELSVFLKAMGSSVKEKFLYSYFSPEKHQLRISARVIDTTAGLNRAQLLEDINKDLKDLGLRRRDYDITNLFVLYQDILERLVDSQVKTIAIVYFFMFLVLLIVFRSFKVAFIALIPNFVTSATVLGVMGIAGIPLDLMTVTIVSVAMGISVDDTIHYIDRFLQEDKSSIRKTHLSVGFALLYSTLIILIGFSSLSFSNFIPSVYFGLLTSFAMVVALISDLTILPVLLSKYASK